MARMFQKRIYRKPEEQIVQRGPVSFSDGPIEHVCIICGQQACFGFGVSLLKNRIGVWACVEHCEEVKANYRTHGDQHYAGESSTS